MLSPMVRSFELPDELSARLDDVAASSGHSVEEIVRAALEQRLEQIEDQLNDRLLERIAVRLQEVDYASIADGAIEKIAASEIGPDPLEGISKRSDLDRSITPEVASAARAIGTHIEELLKKSEREHLQRMIRDLIASGAA